MKSINTTLIRLVTLIALLAPMAAAQSTSSYIEEGPIYSMNYKMINVGDSAIKLGPNVKVKYPGKKKASLSDLKVGNYIRAHVIIYRGGNFVDKIEYLSAKPPSTN